MGPVKGVRSPVLLIIFIFDVNKGPNRGYTTYELLCRED